MVSGGSFLGLGSQLFLQDITCDLIESFIFDLFYGLCYEQGIDCVWGRRDRGICSSSWPEVHFFLSQHALFIQLLLIYSVVYSQLLTSDVILSPTHSHRHTGGCMLTLILAWLPGRLPEWVMDQPFHFQHQCWQNYYMMIIPVCTLYALSDRFVG